jgi:hypothetical protein
MSKTNVIYSLFLLILQQCLLTCLIDKKVNKYYMRNSTQKPKGKSRLGDMYRLEGLGLDSFGPDCGPVVDPVEQGKTISVI